MALVLGLGSLLTSCGYHFQSAKFNELEGLGIQRVFIEPIKNETFAPGVDNWVQSGLVRIISQHGKLKLVNSRKDADAVISGRVTRADYAMAAYTSVNLLKAGSTELKNYFKGKNIASLYTANLGCEFALMRTKHSAKQEARVWAGGFSRSKQFPGSNQLGALGKTSTLINESEFERAVRDIVDVVMLEVHESMIARF